MTNTKDRANPTQDTIDQCKVEICREKVAARSTKEAKCTDLRCKNKERQYKVCSLVKAQETYTLYTNLDLCIAIEGIKSSTLVKGKIDALITKDVELNKAYKDLAKSIKEIKNKYTEALEVACKMERCIEEEERCHPDLLAKLRRKINDFDQRICAIPKKAEKCYDKINTAFDSAIDIAGILTFSNIESLTEFCKNLADWMAKLRKDVDNNREAAATKIAEAIKALQEIIESKITTKFEKCLAITQHVALKRTYKFLCHPDCPDHCEKELDDICQKIKCKVPDHIPDDECKEEDDDCDEVTAKSSD